MRRYAAAMVGLLVAAFLGGHGGDGGDARGVGAAAAVPDQEVMELLSGVDFVPGKAQLDSALSDPDAELIAIANDTELDSGLRMRALWALANYPGPDTEAAVQQMIEATAGQTEGTELLLLRAAMYALAAVAPAQAVSTLAPLLEHPVRDVRADAAHALARTGQPSAIPHLRERLNGTPGETEPQVQWALSEAIRSLSEM